ncbi:MAG: hypothetical protein IT392_03120 [Nitrospirae bacterium]|nr:hypothetical protein [Nitrospirota bacterium]
MQQYRDILVSACLKRKPILRFILIVLILFVSFKPACSASLSAELGKDNAGFGIGSDFYFGYALIGLSATFITDAPWSYVQTEKTLTESCDYFNTKSDPENELRKKCTPKGKFHDGDEWEVFGKVGIRLPFVSSIYLNSGLGLSTQKTAQLYVFSEEYCTYRADGTCLQKAEYGETWGQVDKDYFMTFLGGISVEMNRRLLINFDYHSRRGLIAGLMWRY